jgi:hypothetical protein
MKGSKSFFVAVSVAVALSVLAGTLPASANMDRDSAEGGTPAQNWQEIWRLNHPRYEGTAQSIAPLPKHEHRLKRHSPDRQSHDR